MSPSCSAFEIFPDYTHVSMFPVNCSTKYWSRILCDTKQTDVKENTQFQQEAYGEYWINNNTVLQRRYMCPSGFQFKINELCMMFLLIEKSNNKVDFKDYLTDDHCSSSNATSFQQIIERENKNIDLFKFQSIGVLYKFVDILEEFYAEGSDVYINGSFFISHMGHYKLAIERGRDSENYYYFWLPPPYYPTYIPCFKAREQAITISADEISWYRCEDGSVIPDVLVCNGKSDCRSSKDEIQCFACSWDVSFCLSCSCSIFHYQCKNGGCVHFDDLCDSTLDCPHGDDETFCQSMKVYPYFNAEIITKSFITDLCDPTIGDLLMCRSKLQCYNSSDICYYDHSDGVMAYCEDGSHIGRGSLCRYIECRKHYKCPHSYCIPVRKVCDGVTDCPVGDDEVQCHTYQCRGHMRCQGVTYCVPPHEICDGISHCPQQEDEKYCQMCPEGCQCKGTAIYCNNVTTLFLNDQFHSPSALILYNSNYVFDAIYNNYFSKLSYIWLLDIKYGLFYSQLEQGVNTPRSFLSVKFLYLNHQGLRVLPPYFIEGPNIIYANLSHNSIQSVQENVFSLTPNIQILSFVSNKLTSLESHFCSGLSLLSHLYLSDNPLIHIAVNVFLENPDLTVIRSEWYMVCCVAFVVRDCKPQNYFVSSCSDLISSDAQVIAIMIQGIIVIVGNVGALILQCVATHGAKSEKYLIVSLIFADLLMGAYLLAIAAVHLTYNAVFYQIVSEWTSSITCITVGLVNFVSSEMSLLILSTLSFFRMISIEKFGGMMHMKSQVKITCACAWVAIVTVGISYTGYLFLQSLEIRNNMCILFGVSHQRNITPLEYIFQVLFICLNLIFLFVIVISMALIFHRVIKSQQLVAQSRGRHEKSQNVRLIRTGIRLLLLLICNVLTWIPFLTVSIVSFCGLNVHDYILQWVVVLGVPICAGTDPILYNLVSLKARITVHETRQNKLSTTRASNF